MKKVLIGLSIALLAALWGSGSWVFFNSLPQGDDGSGCQDCEQQRADWQSSRGPIKTSPPLIQSAQFE